MALSNTETPSFTHLDDGRVENVYKTPEQVNERIDALKEMGVDTHILEAFRKKALAMCQVVEGNTPQQEVVCTIVGGQVDRTGLKYETMLAKYRENAGGIIMDTAHGTSKIVDDIDYPNAA